jgi:multicomponent Na+:H+ antiporter subunit F
MLLLESDTFYWVVNITLIILGISLIIALIRLLRGPSLPDRVISLDLIAYITIGMIATYSIFSNKPALLDAATVLALIAFLGTTAFARYVQNAGKKTEEDVK